MRHAQGQQCSVRTLHELQQTVTLRETASAASLHSSSTASTSPALSPPTASLPEDAPRLSRLAATHSAAARQSSTAAGKGCSGASLGGHASHA